MHVDRETATRLFNEATAELCAVALALADADARSVPFLIRKLHEARDRFRDAEQLMEVAG